LLAQSLDDGVEEFDSLRCTFGLGARRARYYVRVWQAFRHLDIEREALLAVGWTKLQMVADVVNPKNVRAWVAFLLGHSVQEVRMVLNGRVPLEKLHALMFYLPPADYEIVAGGLMMFGASHVSGALINKERALVSAMAHLQGRG
jgi:hypothetical protein